ncbi:anti-sigma factor family protein [Bacillus sp. AK031]
MKHISYEEWLDYVENKISEPVREQYEAHLYTCDHCMEIYLSAVEALETSFPELSDESGFTEGVMAEVQSKNAPAVRQKQKFYQQAGFHYIVAAAMTILLMYTGVFQQLIGFAEEFERSSRPSITEEMMKKTSEFIDTVENETKEERN